MFPASWHPSLLRLAVFVMVIVCLMALVPTPVTANSSNPPPPYCMKGGRNCRLQTAWRDIDGYKFVNLNISCFCESDEPEEVWDYLNSLSREKCTYLPTDDGMRVNQSTIHMAGCIIQKQVFPQSILDLARRTDHLEIVFKDCPTIRLGPNNQKNREVPLFTVTFLNSKLSGLPRGWLADAQKLEARIENCDVGIIESKAIAGFSDGANVQVDIINSSLTTVKMVAFELPPSGSLTIRGGMVSAWEKLGYQGGAQVTLKGVRLGRIEKGAFNLYGVTSFNMTKCTVASLVAEVVTDQPKGSARNVLKVAERQAHIMDNIFAIADGEAFVKLCKFTSVLWQNNSFINIVNSPIRIQDEGCDTKRNWSDSIFVTGQSCTDCDDFSVVNEQTCAFYRRSYCTSCNVSGDNCVKDLLPFLIQEKCPISHPALVSDLTEVCDFDPKAPRPSARSLDNGALATMSISDALIIVALVTALQSLRI